MNILQFAHQVIKFPKKYQLRTASGRIVNIAYISDNDPFPIRGEIIDSVPGLNTLCQWDKNGYPHNLPYNHGLNLIGYTSEIVWNKLEKDTLAQLDK